MKTLTLTKEQKDSHIELPLDFIDTEMPQASGDALKVYLYLCRAAVDPSVRLSVTDMADLFDVTPKRILQSLSYWESCGLLALSYSGEELSEIRMVSGKSHARPEEPHPASQKTRENIRLITDVPSEPAAPEYTGDTRRTAGRYPETTEKKADVLDPAVLDRDAEFSELLGLSEYYLKHPLNSSQRSSLGICYLMFGRQSDVIEYLLEYCIERGRTSFRYIEGVARGWKADGYETLQDIKAGTHERNKTVYTIMNAFGLGSRQPAEVESDYIAKWAAEFDLPVILAACSRTMEAIHAPSFRYADSILSSWKESGVRTVKDIEAADREFRAQKPQDAGRSSKPARPNAFRNFDERDTDYDSVVSGYLNS